MQSVLVVCRQSKWRQDGECRRFRGGGGVLASLLLGGDTEAWGLLIPRVPSPSSTCPSNAVNH